MLEVFTLGQVLSVTTGRLMCKFDELYEILNYMTNDNLYTHQLPRAATEVKPVILEQYPELADITVPDTVNSEETVKQFLLEQDFTDLFYLTPMTDFVHKDPISELIEMRGSKDGIIVVEAD